MIRRPWDRRHWLRLAFISAGLLLALFALRGRLMYAIHPSEVYLRADYWAETLHAFLFDGWAAALLGGLALFGFYRYLSDREA